jgi:transcriptional regulator
MKELLDCHQLINEFGFGIIISSTLTGTHLPFLLKENEGSFGTLYAHCARSNPHWKTLDDSEVLVIFNGPHSYISPRWYAQTPAVPTWNYAAVHVYGKVSLLTKEETLNAVNDTVNKYEPKLLTHQTVMTDEYTQRLLSGIVGFKVELTKIEGKQKLGQQKSKADQQGVYQALSDSTNLSDIELANYMNKVNLGTGSDLAN